MKSGEVLAAGKYRIEGELGAGGMSIVLAARDLVLDRSVAIKILQGERSPHRQERLLREARAVARLESDHIVRILDTGETAEGQMFIVMERLEGRDLDRHLRRYGKLPPTEAALYVLQACEALAHAHHAGIVHRDIKPSNMFLVRRADGRRVMKLLDFGIARAEDGPSLTHAGMLGTPQYMSPEQIKDPKDVDARSDIWSLGVTFFQLLTTKLPFGGVSLNEIVTNIFEAQAPTLASLDVEAPAEIEAILRKCLERERDARYPDVLALADAVLPLAPPEAATLRDGIRAVMRDDPATANAPSLTTAAATATATMGDGTSTKPMTAGTATSESGPPIVTGAGATLAETVPLTHDAPLPDLEREDGAISDTLLAAATPAAERPPPQVERRRGASTAIAIGAVAVLVAGAAGLLHWRSSRAPSIAAPATAAPPPPSIASAAPIGSQVTSAPEAPASPSATPIASAVAASPPSSSHAVAASAHPMRGKGTGAAQGTGRAAATGSGRAPPPSNDDLPEELRGRR